MRFKGDLSLINYLVYIDNLIIKAILKFLGLSTFKDIVKFLDWVKVYSSKDITILVIGRDLINILS